MQITMKLGISRDTVRRYQRMNEKVFFGGAEIGIH